MTLKASTYFVFAAAVILAFSPAFHLLSRPALAHPGRTDTSGGHYCRTNCAKWGLGQEEYHKHNAGGGYTNSKGQTFDKEGNPVGGGNADKAISSPTPPPAAPQQAQQTAPAPVKAQPTPTPTPAEQGDVLGTAEETSPTPEPSPEEPSPTPTSSPKATATANPTPTPESEPENGSGGGATAATLGTLAILGGGGYYLYRRFRK